ncbi:NAD-dependent epimerase/dehydratase family protein [Aeromonas veronii]
MLLLTGTTGFIGGALLQNIIQKTEFEIRTYGRRKPVMSAEGVHRIISHCIGPIAGNVDYTKALEGIEVVIHCAAIAHLHKDATDRQGEFNLVNCDATIKLARQAAENGVKRFIFISSIGINGGHNQQRPFRFDDIAQPWDSYTKSKYLAELALRKLSSETGLEIVIIRPPLIYGPNAPGNFGKLLQAVYSGYWLPLGSINNKRSFVALDNLIDLIITCIEHPKAANQTFLVSDDQDISTTELLTMMYHAAGKSPHLLPIPMSWLRIVGRVTGKQAIIERLCGDLQVDINHTKDILGWTPPISIEDAIQRCFDERELHDNKSA